MVKNKDAATYLSALQLVISYYNSHGHVIRKIRCDAGSTEADAAVIEHLATHHKIVVDPAAVGKQNQNPVEREAQTLIKGVGCLMADQLSLGATWWCYAVE
jgi:riboflavin biosynthesis pyrimidine reductase